MQKAADPAGIIDAARDGRVADVDVRLSGDSEPSQEALDHALNSASTNGRVDVVRRLLQDRRVVAQAAANDNAALKVAITNGHVEVVDLLLADANVASSSLVSAFGHAVKLESFAIVKLLLAVGRVCPASEEENAVQAAAREGHLPVVELLLTTRPDIKPSSQHNEALMHACTGGHTAIVQRLLEHPRFDFSNCGNAIGFAAQHGHLGILDYLLCHPRVDPSTGRPLVPAMRCKQLPIVQQLLADPRIDAGADGSRALGSAAEVGFVEAVDLLLADPRVDPAAGENLALRTAAREGHTAVVACLLADPRVDPTASRNDALREAAGHGRTATAAVLLADPRVDPAAFDNCAVQEAISKGHKAVVDLLLDADPRVDPSADGNFALVQTAVHRKMGVLQRLLFQRDDGRIDAVWRGLTPGALSPLPVLRLLAEYDAPLPPTILRACLRGTGGSGGSAGSGSTTGSGNVGSVPAKRGAHALAPERRYMPRALPVMMEAAWVRRRAAVCAKLYEWTPERGAAAGGSLRQAVRVDPGEGGCGCGRSCGGLGRGDCRGCGSR